MCGIVAAVRWGDRVESERLVKAAQALDHRGPDEKGVWVSPTGAAGLAHARLSIMDVDGGSQPMTSHDGTIAAVVNGEFYDFERIRGELEAEGHRFKTRSDSEILIHLYEEYGYDAIDQLRGEFAFALWDERNRRLICARDRLGIKPLVFAPVDGGVLVASEAKALFALGLEAAWDEAAFLGCASMQYLLPDRTLFRGVRQLRPAHALFATDGQIRTQRYWDFNFRREDEPKMSEAEAMEAFDAAVNEAVRLRLRSDVPVGCYLSGGLDSCAVLGMARKHTTEQIKSFTISFEDRDYDELDLAREMAEKVGVELTAVPVTNDDIVDNFISAVAHSERLCINAHGVARWILSAAVQDAGLKVVLTGEGADELLAGYPHFRRDLFAQAASEGDERFASANERLEQENTVSAGILLPVGEALPLDSVRRILGFVPTSMETKSTFGFRTHKLLSEGLFERVGRRDYLSLFMDYIDVPGQLRGRHRLNQSLYLWSLMALPNYGLVVLADSMEMAHSIEARVPLLDHKLMELATRLPIDLKIRDTTEKYILREVARPVLTDAVYRRQKHPFFAPPMAAANKGKMATFVQDTLRSSEAEHVPFYDRSKLRGLLDRLDGMSNKDRTATDPVLMMALSSVAIQSRYRLSS